MNEINIMCATTARAILVESRTYNKTDRLEILADLLESGTSKVSLDASTSGFKDHFTYAILPLLRDGFVKAQDSSCYSDDSFSELLAPLAYVSTGPLRRRLAELLGELCVQLPSFEETSAAESYGQWPTL